MTEFVKHLLGWAISRQQIITQAVASLASTANSFSLKWLTTFITTDSFAR